VIVTVAPSGETTGCGAFPKPAALKLLAALNVPAGATSVTVAPGRSPPLELGVNPIVYVTPVALAALVDNPTVTPDTVCGATSVNDGEVTAPRSDDVRTLHVCDPAAMFVNPDAVTVTVVPEAAAPKKPTVNVNVDPSGETADAPFKPVPL